MTLVAWNSAMDCPRVLERLSEYLDDELEGPERGAVEFHLGFCPSCSRFAAELELTVRALHDLGRRSTVMGATRGTSSGHASPSARPAQEELRRRPAGKG